MLKFMRKYATGYMVKAMFGLIIVVFVFWGVGSFRESERTIAEVGPYKISIIEYQEEYNRILNMYRTIYKEKLDENLLRELNLKEKVMNEIVDKYILIMKAKELGISVSNKEYKEHLESIEMFKRDGKFSEMVYKEILKRNGLDPKRFEQSEKHALLNTKMINLIRDTGALMNEGNLWNFYVKEKGKVNLGYVEFDPATYRTKVTVSDQEVVDIYEKEKNIRREENIYKLRYLLIDEKSGIKDDAAYLELLKAKDLEAYGKQKGLQVTDLGQMKEGDALKKLKNLRAEEWLKSLKKGEISLPVRVDTKSYIFQVVDFEEGKLLDKTVAMKEIKDRLINEKARGFAKNAAQDLIEKKNIDSKKETGFIPRTTQAIPKIGQIPKDDLGLLALSKESPLYNKPVEIDGTLYVFSFKDEQVPSKDEWEKNKEGYKRYALSRGQGDFLRSFMETLRKKEKVKIEWKEIS
jgi:peptidyl-prolyl cis-trans isomerase D